MTTTVRYQFINGQAVPTVVANFPSNNDGDDKQEKIIRRVITAGDIGTTIGLIGYVGSGTTNPGALVGIIPQGQIVLSLEWHLQRPSSVAINGMTEYTNIEAIRPNMAEPDFVNIRVGVATDNTIRVRDTVPNADGAVIAGDILIVRVILGQRENALDVLNFR